MSIVDLFVRLRTTNVSVMRFVISLLKFKLIRFFHQTLNSTHDDHNFQRTFSIIIINVIVHVDYDLKNRRSVTSSVVHRRWVFFLWLMSCDEEISAQNKTWIALTRKNCLLHWHRANKFIIDRYFSFESWFFVNNVVKWFLFDWDIKVEILVLERL